MFITAKSLAKSASLCPSVHCVTHPSSPVTKLYTATFDDGEVWDDLNSDDVHWDESEAEKECATLLQPKRKKARRASTLPRLSRAQRVSRDLTRDERVENAKRASLAKKKAREKKEASRKKKKEAAESKKEKKRKELNSRIGMTLPPLISRALHLRSCRQWGFQ